MGLVLGSGLQVFNINTFSEKVLDVGGQSVADGAPVIQWDGNGQKNQKWYVDPCGADEYRIVARHSGRVLDLKLPLAAGSLIQQYAWGATDNQRWKIVPGQDNTVQFESVADSNLVLDVSASSKDNGAPIIVWTRLDQPNQQFRLTPILPS